MSAQTGISWCDSTFNSWIGCTRVSPACDDCYAARSTPSRALGVQWGAGMPRRRTGAANWKLPGRWNLRAFCECENCGWRGEAAAQPGEHCNECGRDGTLRAARRRVFCASLADVFDNEVPNEWRRDLFDLIRATQHLDWLLLTKRIGQAQRLFGDAHLDPPDGGSGYDWPVNVWLGATVINQEEADRDIPKLLAIPARVRFLSCEPLLGSIDFRKVPGFNRVNLDLRGWWVIAGGESGPRARPTHPDWVRALRDQCAAAGVAFHFKQWGEWAPGECQGPDAWQHLQKPRARFNRDGDGYEIETSEIWPNDGNLVFRLGKKTSGRALDGRQHNQFPVGA